MPDGGSSFTNVAPRMTWGADAFGVVWASNDAAAFQRLDSQGAPVGTAILGITPMYYFFSVRRTAAADWAIFGSGFSQEYYGRSIASDGTLRGATFDLGKVADAHVAVSGTGVALITQETSMPNGIDTLSVIRWQRRTSLLEPVDNTILVRATSPAEARAPVIAGTGSGYAVAWKETAVDGTKSLRFAEFATDGT